MASATFSVSIREIPDDDLNVAVAKEIDPQRVRGSLWANDELLSATSPDVGFIILILPCPGWDW